MNLVGPDKRYETNPFLENMTVPVKGRQVRLSRLGRDDNVLVNQSTGEVLGTHVTTFKPVDGEQFVKLFTANVGLAFDLTSAGIKTFTALMWTVQNYGLARDEVPLDGLTLERFLNAQDNKKSLSMTTFKRGILELEKAQIIAKTRRKGDYFINPNFIFNGDRIAFTTVLHRKKKAKEDRDTKTIDMFDGLTDAERRSDQES
jgi:hypothetical protein